MIDHLIWSTIAAAIAVAATRLVRGAAPRYALLLAALVRFVLPTHWLAAAGTMLVQRLPAPPIDFPAVLLRTPGLAALPAAPAASHAAANLAVAVWALVCSFSLGLWMRRLRGKADPVRSPEAAEIDAFLGAKQSLGIAAPVELRIARADHVPSARGWWRPCVVLPEGLAGELNAAELRAVLAHELAHVRRRDNLTAALARVIVAVFWFHPLLWWIERRLLAERERACDEMVLERGASAQDYLAAILKVCRMSFAGAAGYAGATGSNLKNRMEQIMSANSVRMQSKKMYAAAGVLVGAAVLMPLAGGFLWARPAPQAAEVFDTRRTLTEAEELESQGKSDEAIALVQTEADKNPGRMDLHLALGNMAVHTGRYDLAIREFQRVLDNTVNDPKAAADLYLRLGETFRRKGDLNMAIATLEKARMIDPNKTAVIQTLALALDAAGRTQEAQRAYEEVIKLDPRNGVAMNNLAYLVTETGGDLNEALELAERARKVAPGFDEVVDTLGWVYLKKGLSQEAVLNFREAVERQTSNATFHYHLGLALARQGDRAEARREFEAALKLNPPGPEAEKIQKAIDGLR